VSKKFWFLLILLLFVIGVIAASRFVAGFDNAANNIIVQPIFNGAIAVHTTIVTHPWYMANPYFWGVASMFAVSVLFTLVLWPKVRSKVPTTPLAGLQEKVHSSTPQTISTASAEKTIPAKAETSKSAELKVEEVKPET